MPSSPYALRMDDDLRQALEYEAEREERPAAQLAVHAIKLMVKAKVAKRQAIDAALNEADQGRFISQDAINRWMDSWDSDHELPMPEPDISVTRS